MSLSKQTRKMPGRNLPTSMSLTCIKTPELKDMVMEDVTQDDETKPHYFKSMTKYTLILIDFKPFHKEFQHFLEENVLDLGMKYDLEHQGVINWCRTIKPLFPLKTRGDGNCLLHAVSLAMWGIHDSSAFLRRLMLVALVNDGQQGGGRFQNRWKRSKTIFNKHAVQGGIQFNNQEWEIEWNQVLNAASDIKKPHRPNQPPYDYLEDIHVFVLANILRRPIIILGDHVVRSLDGVPIADNHFPGIYLPLLWRSSLCVNYPIVLGYSSCHFTPLLGQEVELTDTKRLLPEDAVPLVTRDIENLVIRFLSGTEESHYDLLKKYLHVKEVNWTRSDSIQFVPCAKLKYKRLSQFDLLKDHIFKLQKVFIARNVNGSPEKNEDIHDPNNELMLQDMKSNESFNLYTNEEQKTIALKKKKILESSESESEIKPLNIENKEVDISFPHTDPKNSTIEHICEYKTCDHKAIPKTHPYCFGHRRKRSNSASLEDILHLNENLEEIKVSDQCNRNSMNGKHGNFDGTSKPCKAQGCSFYGLQEWGYMCANHRHQKHPQHICGSSSAFSNEWHKCRKKECSNHGQAHCGGLCKDCFISEDKKNYEVKKCINPRCEFFGVKEYNNYCSKCVVEFVCNNEQLENSTTNEDNRGNHNEGDRNVMNSMDILGLLPGRPTSEMKNAREFYKCQFHNCRQLATESTLGYCTDHFLKMFKIGKINIPTEEEVAQFKQEMDNKISSSSSRNNKQGTGHSGQRLSEKRHTIVQDEDKICTRPGCSGIRYGTGFGMCLFCYDAKKHGKSSKENDEKLEFSNQDMRKEDLIESAAPESSSSSDTCRAPVCQNKGKHTLKGLCDNCYGILTKEHAKQQVPISAKPTKHSTPEKLFESVPMKQQMHKCKTPNCNMYGTQPQMGYCSKCFNKSTAADQERQLLQEHKRIERLNMMTEAEILNELPIDRTLNYPRMCITPGCDLYGDPVFRGFCSRCAEGEGILHRSSTSKPIKQQSNLAHCKMPIEQQPMEVVPQTLTTSSESEDITGYKAAMIQIENSNRLNQKCKTKGCENYGSSRNKGYCSSCA